MSKNLEYREKDKDREKEKVGGRPAKLIEKKGNKDLEREIKNKADIFLLGKQHENFLVVVRKWQMLLGQVGLKG